VKLRVPQFISKFSPNFRAGEQPIVTNHGGNTTGVTLGVIPPKTSDEGAYVGGWFGGPIGGNATEAVGRFTMMDTDGNSARGTFGAVK
jgi:hypothetical protein